MDVKKKTSLFVKDSLIDMVFYGKYTNKKSYPSPRNKIEYDLPFPVKRVFVQDLTKKERVYVQFEVIKGKGTKIYLTFNTPLEFNETRELKFTAQAHRHLLVNHETSVQGFYWPRLLNTLHVENDMLFSISHLIYRSEIKDHTMNVIVDSTIPYLVSWRPWRRGIQFEIGDKSEYNVNVNIPINIKNQELSKANIKVFGFKDVPYQNVELVNTNLPASMVYDEEENSFVEWKIPLLPVGNHVFTLNFKITRRPNYIRRIPDSMFLDKINYSSIPQEWIEPTSIWDRNDKTEELAKMALDYSNNIFKIISFLNHELSKILSFKKSVNRLPVTQVLSQHEANPSQYNDVFVSLLRQLKIPTRLALGFIFHPFKKILEPHAWPEIYLSSLKSWFAFDPSFGYLNGIPSQHILQIHEVTTHYPKQYWITHNSENSDVKIQVSLYYKIT